MKTVSKEKKENLFWILIILIVMVCSFVACPKVKAQDVAKSFDSGLLRFQKINDSTWYYYSNLEGADILLDKIHLKGDSLYLFDSNLIYRIYFEEDLVPVVIHKKLNSLTKDARKAPVKPLTFVCLKISKPNYTQISVKVKVDK